MEYVRFDSGAPGGFPSPSTVSNATPPSGSGNEVALPVEFSVVEGSTIVNGGTKMASILSGEFDMYSFNKGGLDLFSFDISAVSLDLENEKRTLSLFDLGNASASAGIGVFPYASVLVSLWSLSVTFNAFSKTIEFSLHIGALGGGAKFGGTTTQIDYAPAGFGFSLKLSYLQSRYYDPEVGRFLNADAFATTGQDLFSSNVYMNCNRLCICTACF